MRQRQNSALLANAMISVSAIALSISVAHAEPSVACDDEDQRICGARSDNNRLDVEKRGPNLEQGGAAPVLSGDGYRISIDGVPSAGEETTQDIQRRDDIAALAANTFIRFDETIIAPVLNVTTAEAAAKRGEAVRFFSYANYPAFIQRAEVRLFNAAASVKDDPIAVLPVTIGAGASWIPDGDVEAVQYVLRVYDAEGRFDETLAQKLPIVEADYPDAPVRSGPLQEDKTAQRAIPLKGGTITVVVSDLKDEQSVSVMGADAVASGKGTAFAERIVPHGEHNVDVVIADRGGDAVKITRPINIARDDHFLVGLADLTFIHQSIEGNDELAAGPETDFDDNFVEGRLAFYYKGKIKGKYIITAAADTREQRIGNLFSNFTEKDQRAFLRRIDPDRYYPVYGDDSVTLEDAPTAGKFYIRVERGASSVLWGNFQTQLTGTEFVNYSRGLYGANLRAVTPGQTAYGEARAAVTAFAADPGTVGSREEFRGTNGTVFYFRNQDIVEGSERLFVEVRDRVSGIVRSRTELIPARDYDFNHIQGRVLLREALPAVSDGVLFVRDAALAGDPVYLVATYEFAPTFIAPSNFTTGGRGEAWLNDHIRIGLNGYRQADEGFEQSLAGGDVTIRLNPETYFKAEAARSNGGGFGELVSGSGGFEFIDRRQIADAALGLRLEGAANLSDIDDGLNGRVSAYFQDREEGFSSPGQLTIGGEALSQYGGAFEIALGKTTTARFKADINDGDINDATVVEGGFVKTFWRRLTASVGVRHDDRASTLAGGGTASPTLNQEGARTDLAVELGYTPIIDDEDDPEWNLRAFGQLSLDHAQTREGNDRIGVGGGYRFSKRAKFDGEVSAGELGLGAKAGVDYQIGDYGSLYLAYTLAAENPNAFNTGRLGRVTAGAKTRYTDDISVFAEGRYEYGAGPTGVTQAYGVDWTPGDRWAYGLSYETGGLVDPIVGDINRDAITGSISYAADNLRIAGSLEYRDEESSQTGDRIVWAWRTNLNYQVNEGLRLYAKLNGAVSNERNNSPLDEAEFLEVVGAGAYRPVTHDKLNILLKYTFLEDLPSPAQITATGASVDFAQRSHVFSVDGSYDLNGWLTVGAKVAHRLGQLRLSRDPSAPWFDSSSTFVAGRVDVRFVEGWELLAEARSLNVRQAEDQRIGGLLAIYRQVGDHVKFGVGYNFTDFSDDLTDLSFNEDGVFINVLGQY